MIQTLPVPLPSPPEEREQRQRRAPIKTRPKLVSELKPRFGLLEGAVLALYCAVLAIVIPHHERWGDEAQAWLLSGRNTAWQIFRYRLHYEGTPPLWHLILRALHLLHGDISAMSWLGAAFAAGGVYVLLRYSPFPPLVRALVPFTFFLQYQYAVVARSYTLFALLLFSLCAVFRTRRSVLFAIVAGLFANLSTHAFLASFLFCGLYVLRRYPDLRAGGLKTRELVLAPLCFAALVLPGAYAAIPAPDVNFAVSQDVSGGAINRVLRQYVGETHNFFPIPPALPPRVAPEQQSPEPSLLHSPRQWAAWQINFRERDANGYPLPQTWYRSWAEFFVSMASQATWPVATSNILASIFFITLFVWLRARRSLKLLLPWLALMLFGQFIWVADHHVGMLFLLLLAAIWIAAGSEEDFAGPSRVNLAFSAAFTVVLALQVVWSATAVWNDIHKPYDPGKETAEWMQSHPVATTAAFHYWSVSIQPYFAEQPFTNIPERYWIWSWKANPDPYYQEVLAQHPDRIVDSVEFPTSGQMRDQWIPLNHIPTAEERRTLPWDYALEYFHANGYVETHRFCGTRFMRMGTDFMDCNLILEPAREKSESSSRAR